MPTSETISPDDLLRIIQMLKGNDDLPVSQIATVLRIPPDLVLRLSALAQLVVRELEISTIRKSYSSSEAATLLGISKPTLYRWLDRLQEEGKYEVERKKEGTRGSRVITEEAIKLLRKRLE